MTLREKLHEIIYEADTPQGRWFDIILIIVIVLSLILVMLDSVSSIHTAYLEFFLIAEWIVTILFTIEYILRIVCTNKPFKYIFSFYGIVDLLSTLPLYLSLIIVGNSPLITLRALRLLRVFRILKVTKYIGAGNRLAVAIRSSLPKIFVFLYSVVIVSFIVGTLMYLVEGPEHGFTSIPRSIYWTIVTLTTVGFGDIHPMTPLGQFIATFVMILGYGIIAVPTGIVGAEYATGNQISKNNTQSCFNCGEENHTDKAKLCHQCGYSLNRDK
jgi:voltage-gated potassium channel